MKQQVLSKYILFIVLSFLLVACNTQDKGAVKPRNNQLVIFFKNHTQLTTNIGSGIELRNISQLDYDSDKKEDTLVVKLNNRFKKIYIKNLNYFKSIITAVGDTLSVEVFKEKTKIKFLNRTLKKYDTIFFDGIYKLNTKKERQSINTIKRKYLALDEKSNKYILKNKKNSILYYKELVNAMGNLLAKKKLILKKILKENKISNPNYRYELSFLKFINYTSLIHNYKLYSDSDNLNHIIDNYLNNKISINDNFYAYGYFNVFIREVISDNYKNAFDLLPKYLTGKNLQFSRELCLYQMVSLKNVSFKQLLNSYKTYKDEYPNAAFIPLFDKKFMLEIKTNEYNVTEVQLLKLTSNTILNLKDLLKANKGKLVYLDFWASWCLPCMREMPYSHKLKSEYKNNNIVFIYISIDTNKDDWIRVNKKLKINKNNFLALNYPSANLYKELNLKTIPRYLLFDKNGKLIYKDAPRPSSKEIRKILDINRRN